MMTFLMIAAGGGIGVTLAAVLVLYLIYRIACQPSRKRRRSKGKGAALGSSQLPRTTEEEKGDAEVAELTTTTTTNKPLSAAAAAAARRGIKPGQGQNDESASASNPASEADQPAAAASYSDKVIVVIDGKSTPAPPPQSAPVPAATWKSYTKAGAPTQAPSACVRTPAAAAPSSLSARCHRPPTMATLGTGTGYGAGGETTDGGKRRRRVKRKGGDGGSGVGASPPSGATAACAADDQRFIERMEAREAAQEKAKADSTFAVLNAVQARVNADNSTARSVFDEIDDNESGRVSADELAKALVTMGIPLDERAAEGLIKTINERYGSKRKALTYDIFCMAFAKGTVHQAPSMAKPPSTAAAASPATPAATWKNYPSKAATTPASSVAGLTPSVAPTNDYNQFVEYGLNVLNAIQQRVDSSNARSVFDSIDDNKSGRVSADELSKALCSMGIDLEERAAEGLIRMIMEKNGSKRKALTYDIFCIYFAKGTKHQAPSSAAPAPSTCGIKTLSSPPSAAINTPPPPPPPPYSPPSKPLTVEQSRKKYLDYLLTCQRQGTPPATEVVEMHRASESGNSVSAIGGSPERERGFYKSAGHADAADGTADWSSMLAAHIRTVEDQLGITNTATTSPNGAGGGGGGGWRVSKGFG